MAKEDQREAAAAARGREDHERVLGCVGHAGSLRVLPRPSSAGGGRPHAFAATSLVGIATDGRFETVVSPVGRVRTRRASGPEQRRQPLPRLGRAVAPEGGGRVVAQEMAGGAQGRGEVAQEPLDAVYHSPLQR